MKKYRVSITRTYSGLVEVEAESVSSAMEKVEAMNPNELFWDSEEFTADFAKEITED